MVMDSHAVLCFGFTVTDRLFYKLSIHDTNTKHNKSFLFAYSKCSDLLKHINAMPKHQDIDFITVYVGGTVQWNNAFHHDDNQQYNIYPKKKFTCEIDRFIHDTAKKRQKKQETIVRLALKAISSCCDSF